MGLYGELRSIREQMRSDFESVMAGMAAQRDAVNQALTAVNQALTAVSQALTEQERILRGFIGRTEERFSQVVDVVERHEDAIADILRRVEALEKKAG